MDKRENKRRRKKLVTIIRKNRPAGGQALMQFVTKDISEGGVFIATEDMSLFDLGEDIDILVDEMGEKYFEGMAQVVRSARIFSDSGEMIESGFGLKFKDISKEFASMLNHAINEKSGIDDSSDNTGWTSGD